MLCISFNHFFSKLNKVLGLFWNKMWCFGFQINNLSFQGQQPLSFHIRIVIFYCKWNITKPLGSTLTELQLTYRQPVSRTIWYDVLSDKRRERTNTVISANQKAEYCVYSGLHAHAMLNVTCFPAFVGASGVISSALSVRYLIYHAPWNRVVLILFTRNTQKKQ